LLLVLAAAWPAAAQFIGYQLPQTVTATIMNAVAVPGAVTPNTGACPPVAGSTCAVPQIGQAVHSIQYTTTGAITSVTAVIKGSYDGVTFYSISDDGQLAPTGTVVAYGYYPFIIVQATTTGAGTITISYTGSVTPYTPYGNQQSALTWKVLAVSMNAAVNQSLHATTPAPFGGLLSVRFGTASCATSSLTVTGGTFAGGTYTLMAATTLVNSTSAQYYFIPPMASTGATFAYTAGGCGAGALLNMSFAIYPAMQMIAGSDYGQPPVISPLKVNSSGGMSIVVTGNTNTTTALIDCSGGCTTTQTGTDQTNLGQRGLKLVVDMTTVGTGSITCELDGKDTVSGKYYSQLTGLAITTNSTNVYTLYPGIAAGANVSASDILPVTWRVKCIANNANATIYTVGASVIN
jgi:hypothetical protein